MNFENSQCYTISSNELMRMVGVIDYDIYYLNDDYHLVVKKGSTVDLKQVERLVNNGHLN